MFQRASLIFAIAALVTVLCIPSRPMAAAMDGIIMQGGRVMMMKAGKAMDPMSADMTISNGTIVLPDGTVKQPGGEEIHMKDGQIMMMDGTIMDGGNPKPMMKPEGVGGGE
jgi:hypothetical protein